MAGSRRISRILGLFVVLTLLLGPAATAGALQATPEASPVALDAVNRVILFSADGMRPDLVDRYVEEGDFAGLR